MPGPGRSTFLFLYLCEKDIHCHVDEPPLCMCPLVLKCNFYPMIIFPLSPFKIGHADKMAVIGGAVRGAQAPTGTAISPQH